ncbi:MAG: hypothetical protein ACTHLW_15105 [Verrucomicrobiota bacterium]
MPIQINLLAEAQELEELRRRDPVKRFILGGAVVILSILVWSSSLLVESMRDRGEVARLESEAKSRETVFKQLLQNQDSMVEGKRKLAAFDRLATNRFLVGTLLNTLQKDTLDHVQLVRLKLEQTYVLVPEVKPVKGTRVFPKPATIKENVSLLLSAKDKSSVLGDGVSKFQHKLSGDPYFQKLLDQNGFRLATLGATQIDTDGKPFLLMSLEGRLPEKIR